MNGFIPAVDKSVKSVNPRYHLFNPTEIVMAQKSTLKPSITLTGLAASPGVVIGEVFRIHDRVDIPRYEIHPRRVKAEIRRLNDSVKRVKNDLNEIRLRLLTEPHRAHADIFQAHIMMLEDPALMDGIRQEIETRYVNAEAAVADVVDEFIRVFAQSENVYLREKSLDLTDLARQIITVLTGQERIDLSNLESEVVVLAHDLTPSDTALMRKNRIIAFATEVGTRISHTAILARSLGIPAVVGIGSGIAEAETGDQIILDGTHGCVILHPDLETIHQYQIEQAKFHAVEVELSSLRDTEGQTLDGHRIEIAANIEFPEEVELIQRHGAKGIGLYRTEYFYMDQGELPSEEQLLESYRYVVERVSPEPTIIRTLDLGGDKLLPHLCVSRSSHSLMGLRSIRLCLKHPEVFTTQLRAILRASAYGNVKIMFPMISGLDELREAKQYVEQAKKELMQQRIPFNPEIELGTMIELPSAAMIADLLAREVDFFSIGTNDLIQYALAVDRRNEETRSLYQPFHPAVLRLIQNVVRVADSIGTPVSVCGEMAGDAVFSLLLIGMGLTKLSMSPAVIPEIKKVICSTSLKEAQALVAAIMK
ncbi:phosphoenolpyruvate--protein phosphotransferase, partial [Candidatus Poribacteria bacterium]|nr:phosphoenolpyruvate--protein phosphotransferase [Candidatus Poribacteria bacterium]